MSKIRIEAGFSTEVIDGLVDFRQLHSGVDDETKIVDAKTDDLNGVLEAKSIPHKDKLVDETKDVEGEKGGNGLFVVVFRSVMCVMFV